MNQIRYPNITGKTPEERQKQTENYLRYLVDQLKFALKNRTESSGGLSLSDIHAISGKDGKNGISPHVGDNGNWFIGDNDTRVPATGPAGGQGLPGLPGKDGADGKDGYTPVKGVDYFDGLPGADGKPGEDGYTPIKGVDYFDGLPGKDGADGQPGKDGYTPVKGVDYFDGQPGADGKPGEPGKDGYTPVKGVDYFDGTPGRDGIDGKDGKDGYSPVRGKDYWTTEDIQRIITDSVNGVLAQKATILEVAYPVGAIYMSTVSTSPKTLFGFGTWEQIQDRFLLASGSTYAAGSTGGSATHTLTIDEMPSHTHNAKGWAAVADGSGSYKTLGAEGKSRTYSPDPTGGGQPHNNMPPYLAVYVWKRTA